MFNRILTFSLLAAMLWCVPSAIAQLEGGSITGNIRDTTGGATRQQAPRKGEASETNPGSARNSWASSVRDARYTSKWISCSFDLRLCEL